MPNITSYNVNDVALYYQALDLLGTSRLGATDAAEQVGKRLVAYLEQRRAALALPPLRGQLTTLGDKTLLELRQMRLVELHEGHLRLTSGGVDVRQRLATGNAREARRLILSKMVDTYDNLWGLITCITPLHGRPLSLPVPHSPAGTAAEGGDSDGEEPNVDGLELKSICEAWAGWCREQNRDDLVPELFEHRAFELIEKSRGRSFGSRMKNALQQLVLERATKGILTRVPIYRTIRDRLGTAGAVNGFTRSVRAGPLSIETLYSCLHIGKPPDDSEWVDLRTRRHVGLIYIHEPDTVAVEGKLLQALQDAAGSLVPRAGYYRVYELRDRVCEALRISQGVFNAAFVHLYKVRPGVMSLGVDYEMITAKRLPIEIREGSRSDHFNLVAFRTMKGE